MRRLFLLLTVVLIALPGQAFASHICWIESAVSTGDVVHIVMREDSKSNARFVKRPDGTFVETPALPEGTFDLKEGDVVYLSIFPHDGCTGTGVRKDGKLGLELKSTMRAPDGKMLRQEEFISGG